MKTKYLRTLLLILSLAALSILITAVVAAQAPELWPFSSDPGYQSGEGSVDPVGPAADPLTGLQPDENGYSGPVWTGSLQTEPSGELPAGMAPWQELLEEPQPDDNRYPEPQATEAWSDFYYVFAAGSTLRPREVSQGWTASGDGGCIYANALPGQVMNLHLDLPEGSRIDYLRLFFYDSSSGSDSIAWVTIYDGAGGLTDLTNVLSTGTAGYGTTLSALVEHVVANADHAYVLNWRPNVTGSSMRLCGLRVAYRLPIP